MPLFTIIFSKFSFFVWRHCISPPPFWLIAYRFSHFVEPFIVFVRKPGYYFRMFCREVRRFADICFKIEKFDAFILCEQNTMI